MKKLIESNVINVNKRAEVLALTASIFLLSGTAVLSKEKSTELVGKTVNRTEQRVKQNFQENQRILSIEANQLNQIGPKTFSGVKIGDKIAVTYSGNKLFEFTVNGDVYGNVNPEQIFQVAQMNILKDSRLQSVAKNGYVQIVGLSTEASINQVEQKGVSNRDKFDRDLNTIFQKIKNFEGGEIVDRYNKLLNFYCKLGPDQNPGLELWQEMSNLELDLIMLEGKKVTLFAGDSINHNNPAAQNLYNISISGLNTGQFIKLILPKLKKVAELGLVNDVRLSLSTNDFLAGESVEEVTQNLQIIVNALKGVKILYLMPSYVPGAEYLNQLAENGKMSRVYANKITTHIQNGDIAQFRANLYLLTVTNPNLILVNPNLTEDKKTDGIHPNSEGYKDIINLYNFASQLLNQGNSNSFYKQEKKKMKQTKDNNVRNFSNLNLSKQNNSKFSALKSNF